MDTPLKLPIDEDDIDSENAVAEEVAKSPSVPEDAKTTAVNPALAIELFENNKPSLPPKKLLQSLYNIAMEDVKSHQSQLQASTQGECVVLSMDDVWLPAAVYQVQQSLKVVQAKVQRDGTPEQVESIKQTRIHLLNQVRSSLQVLQTHRTVRQEEYHALLQQEEERQLQEVEEELRRQQEAQRKNHPYNQDLWREVATLMTEMQKLEKEERLWDAALQRLPRELEAGVTDKKHDDASAMQVEYNENTPMTQELGQTIQTLDDLQLWTRRVRTSVAQIQPAMEQTEALRKQLYQQHQSNRFKGYPGIQQPKDLLRILSQDNESTNRLG